MSRLPDIPPDAMTDAQRAVFDAIVQGPRGKIQGPFPAWLRNPEMAMPAQQMGAYFRFGTTIGRDLAEIAICVTAAHYKAAFEWWAHAGFAHDAGVSQEVTEAIRLGHEPVFEDMRSKTVYQTARALNERHRLTDDEFEIAKQVLGEEGVVDVIGLCGYYAMVSLTLNVAEVPTPDGSDPFG